jgi:hypothetical protein
MPGPCVVRSLWRGDLLGPSIRSLFSQVSLLSWYKMLVQTTE